MGHGFRISGTSARARLDSRHSPRLWFFFRVTSSFAPFSKSATWSFNAPPCLEVLSFPAVSLSFFSLFQTLRPVAKRLLEVEKFLSSREFLPSSLFNWQDEYRWDKAWRGEAFDKTSEGPGARPVSSFCSFPITGFLAWMLKRRGIKCKLRVAVFHGTSVGPLSRRCSASFVVFSLKLEIYASSLVSSERLNCVPDVQENSAWNAGPGAKPGGVQRFYLCTSEKSEMGEVLSPERQ